VFNEILTGKATLEPETPRGDGPYREPGERATTECVSCGQSLPVTQLVNGRCRTCAQQAAASFDAILANTQQSSRAFAAAEAERRRRELHARIIKAS
jgi:hypothetical protein